MRELPVQLLDSLANVAGFERAAFEHVHRQQEQVTSIRINPLKLIDTSYFIKDGVSNIAGKVPWSDYGYYLKKRPSFTFDPLFHAGCYYVQEASSMFLEEAMRQLAELSAPLKVLDLCGAPGGKSTHLQSLLSEDSILVTNEVIRSRSLILKDNIIKWGASNVFVANNDPAAFKKIQGYFDVIVIDAPCSGSGLFRRDEEAIDEWSLNNVQLCSQRQQRILADILPCLKEGGILIYSTCSYSRAEDEDIADWMVQELNLENLALKVPAEWNITVSLSPATKSAGYRFYPFRVKGEGFFLSCFRKKASEGLEKSFKPKGGNRVNYPEKVSSKERSVIEKWISYKMSALWKENGVFFALREEWLETYAYLNNFLNIIHKGATIGQIMKDKLIPDHALALNTILADDIPFIELNYEQAIRYLQRQELSVQPAVTGWQVVRYKNFNLGWINALPNRVNNYYPKELRILKQANDAGFEK